MRRGKKIRPVIVRNAEDFAALSARDQEKREEAFATVADMRRHAWSLTRAVRENGIGIRDALRFGGPIIRKRESGRYAVGAYDRQFRLMQTLTTDGRITVAARDSRTASLLGQHAGAVRAYLNGKGDRALRALPRKTFTTNGIKYTLETDPRKIDEQARRGEVAYEDLYVH